MQQRPRTPILASSLGDPSAALIEAVPPRAPSTSPLELEPGADDLWYGRRDGRAVVWTGDVRGHM